MESPSSHRTERITETLREELSELIEYEMHDPRVDGVVVVDVQMSPDKRHAHVLLGFTDESVDTKEAVKTLERALPFLKVQLAKRMNLFRMPEFRFQVDISAELGGKLDHLMRRIRKGRPKDA
jgi:ribosome-binding factor A